VTPDAPELREEVDLDLETRRYILELHQNAQRLTHYEILGVERSADRKEIKRAYFKLAALLHPDRHFGKKLGSFRAKMEQLFKRISQAHDTLSAATLRAQYDQRLPAASRAPNAAAPTAPEDAQSAAKRREEEAAAERRRAELAEKVRQHVAAAERARGAGDFAATAGAYRMALMLAPDDASLKTAYAQAARAAAEKLIESHERQALLEERYGRWAAAAVSWKKVASARPTDEKVRERLANALSRAERG